MGALEVCTMLPESLNVREVDTGRDDRILIRIRVSSEARGKISSARVDFRAELTVIIQRPADLTRCPGARRASSARKRRLVSCGSAQVAESHRGRRLGPG